MNIELHLFAINTKIQANKQSRYVVPSGKMIVDISKAWESMEGAEHERETALRHELLRWVYLCDRGIRFVQFFLTIFSQFRRRVLADSLTSRVV